VSDEAILRGTPGAHALPASLRRAARHMLRGTIDALPPLARLRDERLLRRRMREALGYEPDLRNPRTHNERLGHKILFDRDPRLVVTSDKIAVRDFVAERIGAEHLIPLVGTYDHATAIDWDALPARFVLKANHGSGTNLVVRDKSSVDRAAALRDAERWLAENHYAWTQEWAYSRIRPRLLIEEMLQGPDGDVPEDYKIYVFGGHPRLFEVHQDRFRPGYRYIHLDARTLRPVPFAWGDEIAPPAERATYRPPPETPRLLEIASRLGAGFDHVRVDLFLAAGRIWFGELTHYTSNACAPFDPPRYDRILGDLWIDPTRDWPDGDSA
jgi:hypothetical protein